MRRQESEVSVLAVSVIGGLGGPVVSLLTMLGASQHRFVVAGPFTADVRARLERLTTVDGVVGLRSARGRAALVLPLLALDVLREVVRRRRAVDVILANGLSEAAVSVLAALLLRKRLVVWVHNFELPLAASLLGPLLRSRLVDVRWSAVSEVAADVSAPVRGSRPVRLVLNPLDEDAVLGVGRHSDDTTTVVGYLGSARAYKGFDLLPAIMDAAAEAGADLQWLVYAGRGAAPGVDADLDRRPQVSRPGHVFPQARAYERVDIVICPSRQESFGRVVAEAMLNGLPVVASDIPAFQELLAHDRSVLFPSGDVRAAGRLLAELSGDRARQGRIGSRNRAEASRYLTHRVIAHFDDMLGTAGAAGRRT